MKYAILALLVTLGGCASMTPRERTVLKISAAVLIAGAIAAHNADHGDHRKGIDPPDCSTGVCQ